MALDITTGELLDKRITQLHRAGNIPINALIPFVDPNEPDDELKNKAITLANFILAILQGSSDGLGIFPPVETLAELKAIDPSDSLQYPDAWLIHVKSLGFFYLDRSSAETADDTTIIAPNGGNPGRWKRRAENAGVAKTLVDALKGPVPVGGNTLAKLYDLLLAKQNQLGYTPENVANKGTAFGYAPLDGNNQIPSVHIPAIFKEIAVVASIAERDLLGKFDGRKAFVVDDGDGKWAEYIYRLATNSWIKTADQDNDATSIVLNWANITGKPTTVGGFGITDAVTLDSVQTILKAKTLTELFAYASELAFTDRKQLVYKGWVDDLLEALKGPSLPAARNTLKKLSDAIDAALVPGGTAPAPIPNYYVAASGNETNDGKTESAPISLAKLNTLAASFKGGEVVALKRGETFEGSLSLPVGGKPGNPIRITDYGTGAKPILRASQSVSGLAWTWEGNGIWSTLTPQPAKMVWLNGVEQKRAGTDWLAVSSRPGTDSDNQFISTGLQNAGYATNVIVGADLITWEFPWRVGNMKVNAYNAATGLVTTSFQSAIRPTSHFMLQGRKEFISESGEWFYETGTGKLYFKTLNGDSPVNYNIRASYVSDAITIAAGASYVQVENLQIQEAERYGISASGGGHYRFEGNTFRHIGQNAINCRHEYLDIKVLDNEFGHISNRAIVLGRPQGFEVSGNLIQDIGLGVNLPDLRYDTEYDYYDYTGVGITTLQEARNGVVSNNKLYRMAYNGIHIRAQKTEISRNVVDTFSLRFNDGAGIYSFSQPYHTDELNQPLEDSFDVVISNNFVCNGVGNNEHVPVTALFINGIYVDNGSTRYIVEGNTVYDNPTAGIVINFDTKDNVVRYNLSYGNGSAQLMYNTLINSDPNIPYLVNLGNECYGNKLVSLHANQNCLEVHDFNASANYNPFASSGTRTGFINENAYINHYSPNIFVYKAGGNAGTRGDLTALRARFGGDADSKIAPFTVGYVDSVTAKKQVRLLLNPNDEAQDFGIGGGYVNIDTTAISSLSLSAFKGGIALRDSRTAYTEVYKATYSATDGTLFSAYVPEKGSHTHLAGQGTIQSGSLVAGSGAVQFGVTATPNFRAKVLFTHLNNGSTCYFDIRRSTSNSAFIDIIVLRDVGGVVGVYIDELAPAYARRASATFAGVPAAFELEVTAQGSSITVQIAGQAPVTATIASSVSNADMTLYGDLGTSFNSFTVESITAGAGAGTGDGGDPTMGGDLQGLASNAQLKPGVVGTTELADLNVTTLKVAPNAITYPKMQQISAQYRLLGNFSVAGPGNVEELVAENMEVASPPATPTSSGARGQWHYQETHPVDGKSYLYRCVLNNLWVRFEVTKTWA